MLDDNVVFTVVVVERVVGVPALDDVDVALYTATVVVVPGVTVLSELVTVCLIVVVVVVATGVTVLSELVTVCLTVVVLVLVATLAVVIIDVVVLLLVLGAAKDVVSG